MAGMKDVVTAVGEDHLLAGALPFPASIDQFFTCENCTQATILTWEPGRPNAGRFRGWRGAFENRPGRRTDCGRPRRAASRLVNVRFELRAWIGRRAEFRR